MNGFLFALAAGVLFFVGGYFTVRFRAFYLLHPVRSLRALPQSGVKQMLLSLGGTVGVGNIAGVAVAIGVGGSGAVFWMWVGAFVSMALKYAEILLGMLTRKGKQGGAPYYIKEAIGSLAATLFTVLLLCDCLAMGGVIQSNAIAEAAKVFGISPLVSGIFISLLAALVFFLHVDLFALSAYVVPLMSGGYVLASLAVLLLHSGDLWGVLCGIVENAFAPAAATGGVLGILFSPALGQGIVKGLFSNEAGCGTAPGAHVASDETVPARQGLFGALEVFIDTVIMCTLTALVILVTVGEGAEGGVSVCMRAFASVFGGAAPAVLAVFVFLFAFSAIVAFGYYGTQCLSFFHASGRVKNAFLLVFCVSLFAGAVMAPVAVWEIADTVVCLMLLLNTAAVFVCRKQIAEAHSTFWH